MLEMSCRVVAGRTGSVVGVAAPAPALVHSNSCRLTTTTRLGSSLCPNKSPALFPNSPKPSDWLQWRADPLTKLCSVFVLKRGRSRRPVGLTRSFTARSSYCSVWQYEARVQQPDFLTVTAPEYLTLGEPSESPPRCRSRKREKRG